MRIIDADAYSSTMRNYFKKQIENHKSEVDAVDCNAQLQHLLDEQATENGCGWISCDEKFPDTEEYILLSFANFTVPLVGRWERDEDGGAFYVGDDTESCVSQDIIVNAWMPLPKCYRETC